MHIYKGWTLLGILVARPRPRSRESPERTERDILSINHHFDHHVSDGCDDDYEGFDEDNDGFDDEEDDDDAPPGEWIHP